MQDTLTWGALVAAAGSLIAAAKFWMGAGAAAQQIKDLRGEVRELKTAVAAHAGKAELVAVQLADFRTDVAKQFQDYASNHYVAQTEARFTAAIEGMRGDLRGLTHRLDKFFERERG